MRQKDRFVIAFLVKISNLKLKISFYYFLKIPSVFEKWTFRDGKSAKEISYDDPAPKKSEAVLSIYALYPETFVVPLNFC